MPVPAEPAVKPSAATANTNKIDPLIRDRVDRGARSIGTEEPFWEEALCFFDDEQWVERSAVNGNLQRLETREGDAKAKPRWRSRLTRNRYTAAIERLRSRFAARIPVPRCTAPSHNAEHRAAASLAEKVCLSLYFRLNVKRLILDLMVYTFNCGAGYVWVYWNSNVGEFIVDPANPDKVLRTGEIGFWKLHPRELLWEPGVEFADSRWHAVRKAQPVHEIEARDDYTGPRRDGDGKGGLTPDAIADPKHRGGDPTTRELVFVYHYLERPCPRYPRGRWLTFANNQLIAKPRDFPRDVDKPCIHELADITRPHRDRPLGRGRMMIDIQRTYNRIHNQLVAWRNLILNPKLLAPKGSIQGQVTDEPGSKVEFRPIGGLAPTWMPIQEQPVSLYKELEQCIADWNEVTGEGDLGSTESGSQVVALLNERDASRRATFSENLASLYSGLFEHFLELVQRHYTEPRLLEIKTRFGIETIADFLGSSLIPGTTVRVEPGSVAPRSQEAQEAKLIAYADRGWIPPNQAMAAIRTGDADALIDEFELDVAKAHREITQLMAMGRGEGDGPPFAGPQDNHEVHSWVMRAWMKTEDFERQPDEVKAAAIAHDEQHQAELMFAQMQQYLQQQAGAESRGLENANRPAGPGGQGGQGGPSLPSVESNVRALQGTPTHS